MRQVGLRLVQLVPILFIVSVFTFLLVELQPGDPAIAILGENAQPETIAAVRKDLRLDEPLVTRYFNWAGDAIRGAARDLARASRSGLERRRAMLKAEAVRLDGLSPLATLARGYAVARNDSGDTLGSVSQFAAGDRFDLLLRDGSVRASVLDTRDGAPLEQDGAA